MDWGSLIIGFGGIAVAALSLFLTYKTRTSLYREKLYAKQIEAYEEVIRAHNELDSSIQEVVVSIALRKFDTDQKDLRKAAMVATKHATTFHDIFQNNLPFLSLQFAEAIQRYKKWVSDVLRIEEAIFIGKTPLDIDFRIGRTTHADVLQVARRDLGTDPLTQEMLDMIGKSHESVR